MLAIVAGMVVLQVWTRKSDPIRTPGPERGDLSLAKDALPTQISEWRCVAFHPALSPEQLPDGQFWWSHFWNYQKEDFTALVAFDQADWKSWHELTVCYQATGWTLADRQVFEQQGADSPEWYVVASLEKPPLERATVIFSLFDGTGAVMKPPFLGMPPTRVPSTERPITNRFQDRLTGHQQNPPPATRLPDRVLQCQVFVQHSQDLSEHSLQNLIDLHLETITHFRAAWLENQSQHITNE